MFKMSVIRNNVGSGMLMMLAGLSALGGAGYLVSEMMLGSEKILKKDATVESYKQLVDLVKLNLYSGGNCSAAFGRVGGTAGRDISQAAGAEGQKGLSIPLNFGDSLVNLNTGWRAKTGTSIRNITLKIENDVRVGVRLGSEQVNAARATLYIEPDHKGINIFKKDATGKFIYDSLHIKLLVYYKQVGSQKEVVSCFDPASDAAFCTLSLGGGFNSDPSLSPAERCQPDQQCFVSKTGVMRAGTSCPAPYSAVSVGGSLQICSWCHPDALVPTATIGSYFNAANLLDLDIEDESGQRSINCTKDGYEGLTPEEAFEARQEYQGEFGRLGSSDYKANAECLDYQPPQPVGNGGENADNMELLVSLLTGMNPAEKQAALNNGYSFNMNNELANINYNWSPLQVKAGLDIVAENEVKAAEAARIAEANRIAAEEEAARRAAEEEAERRRGGNCFVAGTKITLMDGSVKNIEDVKIGETLLTYDELNKSQTVSPVTQVLHHKEKVDTLFSFTFSDGKDVVSNGIHPFYVVELGDYLTAKEIYQRWILNQQVSVLTEDGKIIGVHHIGLEEKSVKLFNVHVKSPYDVGEKESHFGHNYFANGILVHNKREIEERCGNGRDRFNQICEIQ